jgi:integrase
VQKHLTPTSGVLLYSYDRFAPFVGLMEKKEYIVCKINKAYTNAIMDGTSRSTRRAYIRDTRYFWAWAEESLHFKPQYPIPTEILIQFILEHSGHMEPEVEQTLITSGLRSKPGPLCIRTIRRYLASLSVAHTEHGVASPCNDDQIKLLLRRLQRARATEKPRKKAAVTADLLNAMTDTCENDLIGVRDKALLLVGFASGGRRRSELATLLIEDLRKVTGGYILHLRSSKTDQDGNGKDVPILGEAGKALSTWLMKSGLRSGKIFRGICPDETLSDGICGRTINRIVKKRINLAGLDPAQFGAHSLRSGFITESGRKGTPLQDAMALSCHTATDVAMGYYREGELLRNPAAHLLD